MSSSLKLPAFGSVSVLILALFVIWIVASGQWKYYADYALTPSKEGF